MASASAGMGRLLGLGFIFGAKDQGATRTSKNVSDGLDQVADSAKEAGRSAASIGKLGNAIGALNFLQLDRIGDKLEGLAQRAGISPSSTGLETFGAEFSNTFRRATVGLGPFREEVDRLRGQISGLAYSMDVDAGEMIKAVTGIARSGNKLEDFGISLRTVAGSIQSDILSGQQLGELFAGLSESYGLGAKGASRVVDEVTAIGEAFGFGADAVKRLPEVIKAADPVLARFTNMSIADVTKSITQLSVAMSRGLGLGFEEASQGATELFTALSESRTQIADLVTGVGSDFPELATQLGIATGDIDESMQSILSDPVTFAKRIRELGKTMDHNSPAWQRLSHSIAGMPVQFRTLVAAGEEMDVALAEATKPVQNFEGAFNKMARSGAGTSRTFSESMERLKDRFETSLNGMTSITTKEVLGRQREAYDRLEERIRGFAAQDGALGFLTNAFLNVRRYGLVHGLLPMLEDRLVKAFPNAAGTIKEFSPILADLAGGFMEAAVDAGPLLLVLSQMGAFSGISSMFSGAGTALTAFLGPWGLAIAAITAGVYLIVDNWETLKPILTNLGGYVTDAFDSILNISEEFNAWAKTIDWKAATEALVDGLVVFLSDAWNVALEIFEGSATDGLSDTIKSIFSNIGSGLTTIISGIVSGLFGDAAGGAVQDGLESTMDIASEMFDMIGSYWTNVIRPVFGAFIDMVVDIGKVFYELWDETLSPILGDLYDWFAEVFMDDIVPMVKRGFKFIGEAMEKAWKNYIKPALMSFLHLASDVIGWVKDNYIKVFKAVAKYIILRVFDIIFAFTQLKTDFIAVRDILSKGWELIGTKIRNFFIVPLLEANDTWVSMMETIRMGFDSIALTIVKMIASVLGGIQKFAKWIPGLSDTINTALKGEDGRGGLEGDIRDRETALQAMENQQRRERDARRAEIDSMKADATRLQDEIGDIATEWGSKRDDAKRASDARAQALIDGFDKAADGIGDATARFMDRASAVSMPNQSVPTFESSLESMTQPERRRVVVGTSSGDSESPAANVMSTEQEQTRESVRSTTKNRRSDVDGARQTDNTRAAEEIVKKMVGITHFGPEAQRQLRDALGGSRTRPGPRNMRGSSPGGTGDDMVP